MALSAHDQALLDAVSKPTTPAPQPRPAAPAPTPQTLPSHAPVAKALTGGENPLAPLVPVLTRAGRAAGTGVGKVFDVLNRPNEAALATGRRGIRSGVSTLVHSESPEQYQADLSAVTRPMMGATPQEYAGLPGWRRAANEIATAIITDPLTYAGGAGVLEHLGEALSTKSFTAFSRAVDAMTQSTNPHLRSAGLGLGHAYDTFHYKGGTARSLAAANGAQGVAQFRGLKAINNARREQAQDLTRTLLHQYDAVTNKLTPEDEAALYHAIHTGTVAALAKTKPALAAKAAAFKRITDSLAWLQGDPELREIMQKGRVNPGSPGTNIFRWQKSPGPTLERSPLRGSTYAYEGTPESTLHRAEEYAGGGKTRIEAHYTPRNPLNLNPSHGGPYELGEDTLRHLRGDRIAALITQPGYGLHWAYRGRENAARYLRALGVSAEEIKQIVSRPSTSNALDRISTELAKLKGHDAIRLPWDELIWRNEPEMLKNLFTSEGERVLEPSVETSILDPSLIKPGRAVPPFREGGGFELPDTMQRFESAVPRSMMGEESYRGDYVPLKHGKLGAPPSESGIIDLDQTATASERRLDELLGSRSLEEEMTPQQRIEHVTPGLDSQDRNLLERGEGVKLLEPEVQRKVIAARLASGAQSLAAHDAEQRVAELFGKDTWAKVPSDAKAFFQETYNEPGGAEFWKNMARTAIDVPKVGLFALPFRHMANIGSLLAIADPAAIPATLVKYADLVARGTGSNRLGKVIPYLDPERAAARRATILGTAGKHGVAGAPSFDRQAGWVGKIPGIGEIYKASNGLLWSFDDAAKATRFNRLLRRFKDEGMSESAASHRAADRVSAEMIDYNNRSPFTENVLRYVAPFATYRSKVPAAVAGSVLRHPEYAVNYGRMSPELVGDEQQGPPNAKGQPQVGKSYLPMAEVFRGVENPASYLRASAGYPIAMAASGIGGALQRAAGVSAPDVAFYATYGKDPDIKYLLNATLGSFPGGEAGLGAVGLGEFTNQGSLSGAVRGQTGFGLSRGPSPTQIALPGVLQQAQDQADAARKKGDSATADAIEKAIERVRERYRIYVP